MNWLVLPLARSDMTVDFPDLGVQMIESTGRDMADSGYHRLFYCNLIFTFFKDHWLRGFCHSSYNQNSLIPFTKKVSPVQ